MNKSINQFARYSFAASSNLFSLSNFNSSNTLMSRYRFTTSLNGYSGDNLGGGDYAYYTDYEGDYYGAGPYGGIRHFGK